MREVSIVIPNYNGKHFLEDCLQSLLAQNIENQEIIVVDNGSTDGSLEYLSTYPKVRVLKLDRNYGFCRAVNEGIRASESDYVILLNNDTVVEKDFAAELLKAIKSDENIFSCSSKMIQLHNRELIDDAGDYYCALGWAFGRGKGAPVTAYEQPADIFAACAGAAIYRKEMLEALGYFDEKHFAYLEDIDLGYRARISGYRNVYAPRAVVYHVGSGFSGSTHNSFKVKLSSRNSVYLIYKKYAVSADYIEQSLLTGGIFDQMAVLFEKRTGTRLYIRLKGRFVLVPGREKSQVFMEKPVSLCGDSAGIVAECTAKIKIKMGGRL